MKGNLARFIRTQSTSLGPGELYLGEKDGGGGVYLKVEELLEHAHVIGPTGGGKTRALTLLGQQLIDLRDNAVVVLDPYSGLYHALKSYCYEHGHADRLVTLDPSHADLHGYVTGFNPLLRAASPQAAAACSVETLRLALGANSDLINTPRFGKWAYASFLGLDVGKLTMGDARHVVDPTDDTYRRVFSQILHDTDPQAARAWSWIVEQQVAGKFRGEILFEEQLGSLINRLSLYTTIPQYAAMLSTQRFALDMERALAEKRIVLANLSPISPGYGALSSEHEQRMLGTQILHAVLAAARARPIGQRPPVFVMVDEVHKFYCPELREILSGGRQFGVPLIVAHQFLSQLVDSATNDPRLVDAIVGQPKLRVVFGGGMVEETERLAKQMFYTSLDPDQVKHELYRTLQTARVEWMRFRSTFSASSTGGSRAVGRVSGYGTTYPGDTDWGGWFTDPEPIVQSFNDQMSEMTQDNWGETSGGMETDSMPVVLPNEPTKELGGVQFRDLQEQLHILAARVQRRPRGHAVLHVRGKDPEFFRVEHVPDPPHDEEEIQSLDRERLAALPYSGTLAAIKDEARERDVQFRKLLPRPKTRTKAAADSAKKRAVSRLQKDRKKRGRD